MTKGYRGLPIFVWILLGLLGISAALLSLGERDDRANPTADSFSPSGMSALAELLKRNGYSVRIDLHPKPKLAANEVAVGFELTNQMSFSQGSDQTDEFREALLSQLKQGRRAIIFSLPYDFHSESKILIENKPAPVKVRGREGALHLMVPATPEGNPYLTGDSTPSVGLWDTANGALVRAYQVGNGRLIHSYSGAFATNRFLDRADDARGALELVGLLAKPGDRIVFTEASFGNVNNPGLLESIGAWANAAWQQVLFLGLVVVYTLGKRFGIPEETRPPQKGSRELLEAMTDTYTRGRQTRAAMSAALDRADNELRSALRLPRDATRADRDKYLPTTLASALANLQAAAEMEGRTAPQQALELIARVRRRTDEFLGESRRPGTGHRTPIQ